MKLEVKTRKTGKKGETNQLRREGHIPAILYGFNQTGTPIAVKADEVLAILRKTKPGLVATTIFELHEGTKKHKAVVKDIQYHVADYSVVHIDFMLIAENQPITINVPIQLIGVADCSGVKLGGFIRQVQRTLKVSCLPRHIPQELTLDVSNLGIGQSKRLSDIVLSSHVRPLAKMDGVAVVVGKKAGT